MKYSAYKRETNLGYQFNKVFNPISAAVATADTLEELKFKAMAHLGEFPADWLVIVDADNHILEELWSSRHHKAVDRASRHSFMLAVLLVFCVVSLITTAFGVPGLPALLAFAAFCVLYSAVVKVGLFNEIEGCFMPAIIFVFLLVVLSAPRRRLPHLSNGNPAATTQTVDSNGVPPR